MRLGRRIGKGGEGEVYALADDPRRVVKFYTAHDGLDREVKISAIVRMRLEGLLKLWAVAPLLRQVIPATSTRKRSRRACSSDVAVIMRPTPLAVGGCQLSIQLPKGQN